MPNNPLQRALPVPQDLHPWLECAVIVDCTLHLERSHFPAMVSGMLVVRLAGEVFRGTKAVPQSAFISPCTTSTVYDHCGHVYALGLVLRPEAVSSLFGNHRTLVNEIIPLAELSGPHGNGIEQAVLAAANDEERIDILFGFIRQAASIPGNDKNRQRAKALADETMKDLKAASQRMGVGARQFERRFLADFGMAPKQFQVISRLNKTLRIATASGRPTVHLATDQGYYDQSHMARDMQRLAGNSINGLVNAAHREQGEHWPLRIGAQSL